MTLEHMVTLWIASSIIRWCYLSTTQITTDQKSKSELNVVTLSNHLLLFEIYSSADESGVY